MDPVELETIKKELRDLQVVIDIHKKLLHKFPNDRVVKLSLEQYLFRERELLKKLKAKQKNEATP